MSYRIKLTKKLYPQKKKKKMEQILKEALSVLQVHLIAFMSQFSVINI